MTVPPYDRPIPDSGAPHTARMPAAPPALTAQPPGGPRLSRRRAVIAGSVAGVFVLGGAGIAAGSWLAGGGPQPQDVLPAETLGLVTLDLDPSAGQKLALMSLLDKFPALETEGDGDVRGELLDPLLDESGTGLDYAADVEPWLGDRIAVAAVPADGRAEGVAPVAVLAVTDQERMTEELTRAQERAEFGFARRGDYVLITDSQERADDIAAAEQTLAEDADFAGDLEALGADQVALVWADLSAVERIAAAQGVPGAAPGELFGGGDLTGRVILGVHAADDALEVVGLDFGVSDVGVPSGEPTRLAHGLPEDTVAALSLSGVGEQVVTAWEELEASGGPEALGLPADLGLDLPEDLRTILGTDLAVAAFGDLQNGEFGARVSTEEPEEATRLLDSILSGEELGVPLQYSDVDGGYLVATDEGTLDALSGDGGLGGTEAFRSAVEDAEEASAIGYVDLAAVVEQLVAQGGVAAEDAAKFAAVEALGFSATSTDEGSRFVLRITTR